MEQLSGTEIDAFLADELVGRIGCHAEGVTYVVPVIYAYDGAAFYAHTIEGLKLRLMRANPKVCFEVDRYEDGSWTSVIAQGTFEQLEGTAAEGALAKLAARFAGRTRRNGSDLAGVSFRIVVDEVTGRRMQRSIRATGPDGGCESL